MKQGRLNDTHVFFGVLLLFSGLCYANPISFDGDKVRFWIIFAILFNAAVDFLVLLVFFALLGEMRHIRSRRFILYFLSVVIGGQLIDLVSIMVAFVDPLITAFLVGVMLMIYNTFLCAAIFGMHPLKAMCIGLAMGFFTNPILWGVILQWTHFNPDLDTAPSFVEPVILSGHG